MLILSFLVLLGMVLFPPWIYVFDPTDEFLAAVQKGFDQLDRDEGIPHEEIKKQLASWLIS